MRRGNRDWECRGEKGGLFIEVLSEDIAESVADVVHHGHYGR